MAGLLKDEAYNKIEKMIVSGKFRYGMIYSINALAAEMEMSRTPVRDAVMKMGEEKRVDILSYRGFCLHQMTEEEMNFNRHYSNAIEGYCLIELARSTKKDPRNPYVRKLKHIMLDMEAYLEEDTSFDEYMSLDMAFHAAIIDSINDPIYSEIKKSSMGFYNHPELQMMDKKIYRKEVYRCHQKILDAVCAGDDVGAYNALKEHSDMMLKVL